MLLLLVVVISKYSCIVIDISNLKIPDPAQDEGRKSTFFISLRVGMVGVTYLVYLRVGNLDPLILHFW